MNRNWKQTFMKRFVLPMALNFFRMFMQYNTTYKQIYDNMVLLKFFIMEKQNPCQIHKID